MNSLSSASVDLLPETTKIEIKTYSIDGLAHSLIFTRMMKLISEKGNRISDEAIDGSCISQHDKKGRCLCYVDRRVDGHYAAQYTLYEKKLPVRTLSCLYEPSNEELQFHISENIYDEKGRLTEQCERAVSRAGGKYYSEMRTVFDHQPEDEKEESWDLGVLIRADGTQDVKRLHCIGKDKFSRKNRCYKLGDGLIDQFDEIDDDQSLGYIIRFKKKPSMLFKIDKDGWKLPIIEINDEH